MFDVLLKPKFYSKCKSCLKLTKMRLEAIRKKRNAVQKFLKKDIADLLRSDLDYNAYGRAEGLIIEQNLSSCYELVAKFVGCISDHLRNLYKQRDCPDECKEAISSLMYAAARFSDLPELRQLRTLFTEKYGQSLQPYISKEFAEKLRQDPLSKEMKIRLLCDLAQEFSIEWNSKALEQKLYSPPLLHEEKPKHDPVNDYDGAKWQTNKDVTIPKTDNLVTGGNQRDGRVFHTTKEIERDTLSHEKKDKIDASWRRRSSNDDETTTDNSSLDGSKACSSSMESLLAEDEIEIKNPFSYRLVPPPYVKENFDKVESNLTKTTETEAVSEKEANQDLQEAVVQKKPIPRSVRRRPLKSPFDHNVEDSAKVNLGVIELEKAKQLRQTELGNDGDSRDEEERVVDRLLMHYSKKRPPYESSVGYDELQNIRHIKSNPWVTPVRAMSLPPEDKKTSKETLKVHERANSLVPEMLKMEEGHVHPSLPDYDDLPALLAALRGR